MSENVLRFLYRTAPGRLLLKPLTARGLSAVCGRFLDSSASRVLIPGFIRRANINLEDYETRTFSSFNDCFTRRIRPALRPVDPDPGTLIAPCDGRLTAWPIAADTVVPVKQSAYSIARLLGDPALAGNYAGGWCLVFRLCVEDYHRYAYFDSGVKGENVFLPGRLHTVRPVALEQVPVFTENCREYTIIRSEGFGRAVQMEVGAMLVGRIRNNHGPGPCVRGQEKGRFLYGGSTVILLLEPNRAEIAPDILQNSRRGVETPVKLGQAIGTAAGRQG